MSINLCHSPVGPPSTGTPREQEPKQLRKERSPSAIPSNDQQCLLYTLTTQCHTMFIAVTNFCYGGKDHKAQWHHHIDLQRDLLGLLWQCCAGGIKH